MFHYNLKQHRHYSTQPPLCSPLALLPESYNRHYCLLQILRSLNELLLFILHLRLLHPFFPRRAQCHPDMSQAAETRGSKRRRLYDPFANYKEREDEESWADCVKRMEAEDTAERDRRAQLTRNMRMKEDGEELRKQFDRNRRWAFILQPSPPYHLRRVQCSARECTSAGDGRNGQTIKDDYRVALLGYERKYYHIECLEKMIELSQLAATRFFMDTQSYPWNGRWPWTWGMMVEKWFTRRGYVNLDGIEHFIDAHDRFDEASSAFSVRSIKWQLAHGSGDNEHSVPCDCKFPFLAEVPQKPRLEDFELHATEPLFLSEVLQHHYAERFSRPIVVRGMIGDVIIQS